MWKHFSPCSPCSSSHNPHSEHLQHLAGQKPPEHNECITLQTLLNIREPTLEVESNFVSLSSLTTQILISYVPTYFWLLFISGLESAVDQILLVLTSNGSSGLIDHSHNCPKCLSENFWSSRQEAEGPQGTRYAFIFLPGKGCDFVR